jgi:hypothetical protein
MASKGRLTLIFAGLIAIFVMASGTGVTSLQQGDSQALTVCSEGPPACQFTTIGDAIAAANPDDLITVKAGTYEETLVVGKSLLLVGEGQVRIQGVEPGQPTLTLQPQEDARVLLENLTILGGPPAGSLGDDPRGICLGLLGPCPTGLQIEGDRSLVLTMVDTRIAESESSLAGMSCSSSGIERRGAIQGFILRSQFVKSDLSWGCGGVLHLEEVVFSEAGIGIRSETSATIKRSYFIRSPRGLEAEGDRIELTIEDSWFLYSEERGALLQFGVDSKAWIRSTRFIGNDIGVSWGPLAPPGIDIETGGSSLVLEDSSLIGNRQYGLYVETPEPLVARNNLIQDNGFGVVAFQADEGIEFDENQITGNEKWGIALFRAECGIEASDFALETAAKQRVVIRGENNEMRDNGEGDLCPNSYPWPEGFKKP